MSAIKRLRSWADENDTDVIVTRHAANDWTVRVKRDDQVKYDFAGRGELDAAAVEMVVALEQLGEEIPDE